jgi:glutamyl-tRNA reductase
MSQNTSTEVPDGRLLPRVTDPEEIKKTIRRRAAEIKGEELRTATNQLRSQGHLSDAQERILEEMATNILDELLSAPESMLEDAEELDRATQIAIIELFDPNQ